MIHLGDITKINGAEAPVVDVITGGSPCQDLSVAGKRAGLAGERSGLFMEQIRVIKEMRQRDRESGRADDALRPRYMVWENVPGAFSSNQGKDFAAVLEETIRIVEPQAPDVPVPPKGWPSAGCLYDELGGWSVAWRVHDAQFWGVPQRRKRIALVADFGGLSAPEILFERKGLSRDSEPRTEAGEGTAAGTESGADSAICLQGNGIDRADTAGCNGRGWRRGGSYTLNTIDRPAVMAAGFDGSKGAKARTLGYADEQAPSMTTSGGGHVLKRAYSFDSLASNSMKSANPHSGCRKVEVAKTLDCFDPNPAKNQGGIAVMSVDCRNGNEHAELNGTLQAKPNGGYSYNCGTVIRTKE